MRKAPCVYILASHRNGTLYTGVTSNLAQRIYLHRIGFSDGFSKKYGCKHLVYFEWFESMANAIGREKQLKNWKRSWKLALIREFNPAWEDLYSKIVG